MLDGTLDQNAISDDRQVFTFLRGVIVDCGDVDRLCNIFTGLAYPGNSAIPEEPDYHYTYAGEMPFSSISGLDVSEMKEDGNEQMVSANRWSTDGIKVEIPVQRYSWESYHSVVNQASGAHLPSKRLCEALSLRYRADTWDLHDASGVASLYREVGEYDSQISGSFCYLRRDLLDKYLTQFGKQLVWLMWGERGLHHRNTDASNLHECYANHQHIHKRVHVYPACSGNTVSSAQQRIE